MRRNQNTTINILDFNKWIPSSFNGKCPFNFTRIDKLIILYGEGTFGEISILDYLLLIKTERSDVGLPDLLLFWYYYLYFLDIIELFKEVVPLVLKTAITTFFYCYFTSYFD